jgi:hypothetical protein
MISSFRVDLPDDLQQSYRLQPLRWVYHTSSCALPTHGVSHSVRMELKGCMQGMGRYCDAGMLRREGGLLDIRAPQSHLPVIWSGPLNVSPETDQKVRHLDDYS